MNHLKIKVDYYRDKIFEQDSSNIITEIEIFFNKYILSTLPNSTEIVEYAFTILNELADLKEDAVDVVLESSIYINLWDNYGDNKQIFWSYLNERSRKLYDEAVWLYTNGSTPQEQVHYREKHGL